MVEKKRNRQSSSDKEKSEIYEEYRLTFENAMPQYMFFIGLGLGLMLNLLTNALDHVFASYGENVYAIYSFMVAYFTFGILGLFVYFICKFFVFPHRRARKKYWQYLKQQKK